MTTPTEGRGSEFDERFPLSYFAEGDFNKLNASELEFSMWQEKATQRAKYKRQQFFDFLSRREAEVREEIVKGLEGMKYLNIRDTSMNASDDPDYEAEHQSAYNNALSDAIALIKKI